MLKDLPGGQALEPGGGQKRALALGQGMRGEEGGVFKRSTVSAF